MRTWSRPAMALWDRAGECARARDVYVRAIWFVLFNLVCSAGQKEMPVLHVSCRNGLDVRIRNTCKELVQRKKRLAWSWPHNYFHNVTPVKKSGWSLFSGELSVLLSLAAAELPRLGCEGRLSTGSLVWIVRACNKWTKAFLVSCAVGMTDEQEQKGNQWSFILVAAPCNKPSA